MSNNEEAQCQRLIMKPVFSELIIYSRITVQLYTQLQINGCILKYATTSFPDVVQIQRGKNVTKVHSPFGELPASSSLQISYLCNQEVYLSLCVCELHICLTVVGRVSLKCTHVCLLDSNKKLATSFRAVRSTCFGL